MELVSMMPDCQVGCRVNNGTLPFAWEVGMEPSLLFDRAAPNGKSDQQIIDAMVVGAGKAVGLNTCPNSWTLSSGATNTSTTAKMRFTLNQAGAAAAYTFSSPINWDRQVPDYSPFPCFRDGNSAA